MFVHRCKSVENKNQLDATEWFIALIICSTCFGHLYAHHQERETILVLLSHMVCYAVRVKDIISVGLHYVCSVFRGGYAVVCVWAMRQVNCVSRVIRLFVVPYSCWLLKICCAYAECGLLFWMYLLCS